MTVVPLVDRVGHVGGVESVVVDGRRWCFGMDHGSDLVVSPLVDDPDEMAEFAAKYMSQRDGTHDKAYWAELVSWADENSDLVEPGGNSYDSATLATGVDYGLLYLFGAVTGWEGDVFDDEHWDQVSENASPWRPGSPPTGPPCSRRSSTAATKFAQTCNGSELTG